MALEIILLVRALLKVHKFALDIVCSCLTGQPLDQLAGLDICMEHIFLFLSY